MSKVLIVEDELSIAELEKDYLELSSFEVEIETDGQQGLEKAFQFLWYLQEKKTSIRSED